MPRYRLLHPLLCQPLLLHRLLLLLLPCLHSLLQLIQVARAEASPHLLLLPVLASRFPIVGVGDSCCIGPSPAGKSMIPPSLRLLLLLLMRLLLLRR